MSNSSKARAWPDSNLYPFESRYQPLSAGRMHYIEQGSGEVLLFVHGTPTWSFLYRDFVKHLSGNYRCIAIDHLGFGLSEKPDCLDGSPQWHADNLLEFIRQKDLKNITLVVHDFGGPIGLGAALQESGRIKRVVLFNTWLWATAQDPAAQKIDKMVNSWLGRFLYFNLNFSPKVLLKKGFADKRNLSKTVHQYYVQPFSDKNSRQSLYKIAQSLVGASDWYQQQWEQLHQLEDKEWLILWGTQDEFIKPDYLTRWKERLPQAEIHPFNCGHFVQEEDSSGALDAIRNFMAKFKGA